MSLRVGILTVSDGCAAGVREDVSGALLEAWAGDSGHSITARAVMPDEPLEITRALLTWADGGECDLILTTGGTGFGPRDVTPEATRPVLDRLAEGLAEQIRRTGAASTPFAALSRGLVGSRGRVLIANLPGSPGGVRDGAAVLGQVVDHVRDLLNGNTEHSADPRQPGGVDDG